MTTIIIILILIQFLIKNVSTIECLDFILSRSDTSLIESVDDRKCFANYCTYVSIELLMNENNKTIWVPTRYARECTNIPQISIGSNNIDSINMCKVIYDPNQQLRYFVKICNTNLCNEQCIIPSNENENINNNNNINIYINSNCCDNKSLNCCQNSKNKPPCCNKILPHWPPLGPQLINTSITSPNTNDSLNSANFKCCNNNNPQCCNILGSSNMCCKMMLQYYKESTIIGSTNNLPNIPILNNNNLMETHDTVMINNICCKNYKPNCCSNNLNTIPCCNNFHNVMHPGPIINNSVNNDIMYGQKFEQINTPITSLINDKNNVVNPFLNCCDEKNPFCCIPVETANTCCLKILYKEQKLNHPPLNAFSTSNGKNKKYFKFFIILIFIILSLLYINC